MTQLIETNAVSDDPIQLTEAWFAEHRDDVEFVHAARADPYSVIGPTSVDGNVVYATKPGTFSAALEACEGAEELCLIGRCGLPNAADANWIRELVGSRTVLFLGDLDPPDLMIFAWLRASLHSTRVTHLGINDAYLSGLHVSLPDSVHIPCTQSEQKSLALLQVVLPDLKAIVGANCAQSLAQGCKIELEAVASIKNSVGAIVLPALRSAK